MKSDKIDGKTIDVKSFRQVYIKIIEWSQRNKKSAFDLTYDEFIDAFMWKN